MPLDNPATVQVSPLELHVAPPGLAVATYRVTAEPPFVLGADQESVTCESPGVAELREGGPGTVAGIADSVFDAPPTPAAFVAVTVNE